MRDLAVRSRGKRTSASSPTASEAAAVDLDAVYDDFIGCLKLYLAQQEYEDLGSGLLLRRQDLADAAFETALEHGIGELEDAGCLNKAGDHYRVSKRALQQATSSTASKLRPSKSPAPARPASAQPSTSGGAGSSPIEYSSASRAAPSSAAPRIPHSCATRHTTHTKSGRLCSARRAWLTSTAGRSCR